MSRQMASNRSAPSASQAVRSALTTRVRVRSCPGRMRAEVGRVPADDRLLYLDDNDLGHRGMAKRLIQREADAKAADQDPHARLTAGIERCTDQQALGGAIARVHQ